MLQVISHSSSVVPFTSQIRHLQYINCFIKHAIQKIAIHKKCCMCSAPLSKNAVSANIKHSRYIH